MEKRKMDKLGIETSLLGFGCMRFPKNEDGSINEELSEQMLDLAMASGVNYYDTAYPYHDGESEKFLGKVLDKYDRDSYILTTKLPLFDISTLKEAEEIFEVQMERLHKDYVDFYLLHAMDGKKFQTVKELGLLDFMERLKKEGRIRHIGFSFHDKYEAFEEILTGYDWDVCQIQYNYMDTKENPGDRGYELAEKMGIPVIVMEPVRGGLLAEFSEDIEGKFRAVQPELSTASWALRWVASHPGVKVILSGMSSMEQVQDNLNTFTNYKPMTEQELATVDDVVATLHARVQNDCTGCRYCMPCPAGVNIPRNFRLWNMYHMYRKYRVVRGPWEHTKETEFPKNCIECGRCEKYCPQKIHIREDLKKVQRDLDGKIFP
ncbi:MAG: aldo/keto reductase [Lachnospiraceae bacterium]|nr:aldo/keto reductase [Lachnospiraceae bacterium]